jgi:mersacidin/lichenicidin family type 2 lantibiotic
MSNVNVIRAWKDPDYRRSLSEAQRARLPAHPSGAIEFQDRTFGGADAAGSLVHGCSPCHKCLSGPGAP